MNNVGEYRVDDVIKYYNPMVSRIASKYSPRLSAYGLSIDDLEQECRVAIWKSCSKVQPYTENFARYATKASKMAIRELLIRESCRVSPHVFEKKIKKFPSVSELTEISYDKNDMESMSRTESDTLYSNVEINEFIDYCRSVDERYAVIVKMRIDGYSLGDISSSMMIKERTLDRLIVDIQKLYNDYTNGEGGEPNVNAKHTARDRRVRRTSLRRVPHRR